MVSRNSRRIACSFNRSGSAAGLGVGFSKDTSSLLLSQARLVFSSSFTRTELSESCWSSSGEAKSGFPTNFFSRNSVCLFLEQDNAEGNLFFFRWRLFTGFSVLPSVTLLLSLALLGSIGTKFATELTRIYPDSVWVSTRIGCPHHSPARLELPRSISV